MKMPKHDPEVDAALTIVARTLDLGVQIRFSDGRTGVRCKGAHFDFLWVETDDTGVILSIRLPEVADFTDQIAVEGIIALPYDHLEQAYRLRIGRGDMVGRCKLIGEFVELAHRQYPPSC